MKGWVGFFSFFQCVISWVGLIFFYKGNKLRFFEGQKNLEIECYLCSSSIWCNFVTFFWIFFLDLSM